MSLPSPRLDDRDFASLVAEAKQVARRIAPDWDSDAPGDPGMILVELFAHLTELLLYRLDQVPDKLQVELLRLVGVDLRPPAAARTSLLFEREDAMDQRLVIRKGFPVACAQPDMDGNPVVFSTVRTAVLEPGQRSCTVPALHARYIVGEALDHNDPEPQLAQAPVIAPSGFDDVILGVGLDEDSRPVDGEPMLYFEGRYWRIWEPVTSFAQVGGDPHVFTIDRMQGRIRFASDLGDGRRLAAIPPAGAPLRAWYRTGGGSAGNVGAGSINVPQEPLAGIHVHNPHPAMGGLAAESLDQARERGPLELNTLQRAVTARDFELLACRASAGIDRARAFTTIGLWPSAEAGTVSLRLVPRPGMGVGDGRWHEHELRRHHSPEILAQVRADLDKRRPMGTRLDCAWVHYKPVRIDVRVLCEPDRNPARVRESILGALYRTVSPIAQPGGRPWPFGRSLHSSLIYGAIMAQPGVAHIDGQVRLEVDLAPDRDVKDLDHDRFKPDTWFACTSARIFRSTNAGQGWECLFSPELGQLRRLCCHPWRAGLIAALIRGEQDGKRLDRIILSSDYGEHWQDEALVHTSFEIEDLAWLPDADCCLLLATDAGCLQARPGQAPQPIRLVDDPELEPRRGFYAIATAKDGLGRCHVVLAAQAGGGVFHSDAAGAPGSFRDIGLSGANVRRLLLQPQGNQLLCWAGFISIGASEGQAPQRFHLHNPAGGWQRFDQGWQGGSCLSLAAWNEQVLVATHHAGVLLLEPDHDGPRWRTPLIGCGLPLREQDQRLETVRAIGVRDGHLLAAGDQGIFAAEDGIDSQRFRRSAQRVFVDQVTLPEHWLFCSDAHRVDVVSAHAD